MEFILAATLLAAPPGTPEPPVPSGEWPALQTALHQVAVEWEIMDPREVNFVFARQENFVSDLNLLRQRYQDLADAPRAWDAQRFPDRGSVNELVTFNRNFRKHLETQQLIEPDRAAVFRQAARETDRLYEIYNAVRDARCDYFYVTVRRQALKRLRDMIGPDAYYAGQLPPFVPIWYFQEID